VSRIDIPEPKDAPAESQRILGAVAGSLGQVPSVIRILSLSPNALEGFASLQGALAKTLSARTRHHISLAVSEVNGCGYCLSAHSHFGSTHGKLSPDDIRRARSGSSDDPKEDAAVRFAKAVVATRGKVEAKALADVRAAGFSDANIVEIIALSAQFSLTNLINNVFDTPLDFPAVEALPQTAADGPPRPVAAG